MKTKENRLLQLERLKNKAWSRYAFLETRASDDEKYISDGGRYFPRYKSARLAKARWQKIRDAWWNLKKVSDS